MDHGGKQQREPHPRKTANIFSILSFYYTLKLFRKGTTRDLNEDDLYEVLPEFQSKQLGDKAEREWENQKKNKRQNSVLKLIWVCFGKKVLLLGMTQLVARAVMIILQPHALSKIISYFNPGQTEVTKEELYMWAVLLVGLNFLTTTYSENYYMAMSAIGIQIRAAVSSLIYRKVLKLSPSCDISIGNIITLITKDVQSLQYFCSMVNDLWVSVFQAIVAGVIIYKKIGLAALVGIGCCSIVLPLQFYMGTWATRLRLRTCKKTDERLQQTRETLSAIKIIKMYTWENFFKKRIIRSRELEIKSMQLLFYLNFVLIEIGVLNSKIAFYFLIMTYQWLGNHLTADVVYYIESTFNTLTYTIGICLPMAIAIIAEVIASIKRLGSVLKDLELEEKTLEKKSSIKPKITLKNVQVSFKNTPILHSINLNIDTGLTIVFGPVGSGKSFLLKTILKEYEPTTGSVLTQGRISYCSQESWLFPSSIKQNILFGAKYDEARYQEVLKVCALLYDLDLLTNGDKTIVEDRGNNLSKGQQARINLARSIYKDSEIYLLDDCFSSLDGQVSEYIFKECLKKFLQNKLVVFVSHNVNFLKDVDNVVLMRHGTIISHARATQISEKEVLEEDTISKKTEMVTETTKERKVYQESQKKGGVELSVYKRYLQYSGRIYALLGVASLYLLGQFSQSYADKLVSKWVNLEQEIANFTYLNATNVTQEQKIETVENRNFVFQMYTAMLILGSVLGISKSFGLYALVRRACIKLHKHMITHIINATMHFFDTHFIGNILNRCSKDLTVVDELLPFLFHHAFWVIFVIPGTLILIATVNAYLLIPSFFFFVLLMIIQRYYLKTTRNLQRLDASTKSPLIGHMNATLEGLTTIRACKAEEILRDEFDNHQDLYTSATYIFLTSIRAFAFCLDNLCTVFVGIIIATFVFWRDVIPAGDVGLAISQGLNLTGILQWAVRMFAEMENSMTCVERVLEYTEAKQESIQGQKLDKWPSNSQIKYENVNMSYNDSHEIILKNINFVANPCEKIGIVGRTGAGKSTIISTLFRLYEAEGTISIDNINTKLLTLSSLRKHISIIPQDPFVFTGTIRENIDPEKIYTDEEIWRAIKETHLKKLIPCLDYEITAEGASFSVGQKQLISIARAIVRNNKIIVLDEATASMDPETDILINETINKCFASCTVLTIAHKLHSVMNCHKVIVINQGEIVECDEPRKLLQNKDSYFYKMASQAKLH